MIYMLWDVLGGVDTETAYMKDRQPSTGTPLGIPEDRLHEGRTSLHVAIYCDKEINIGQVQLVKQNHNFTVLWQK